MVCDCCSPAVRVRCAHTGMVAWWWGLLGSAGISSGCACVCRRLALPFSLGWSTSITLFCLGSELGLAGPSNNEQRVIVFALPCLRCLPLPVLAGWVSCCCTDCNVDWKQPTYSRHSTKPLTLTPAHVADSSWAPTSERALSRSRHASIFSFVTT